MIKVPKTTRTYQVAEDDFPINIQVQAKGLNFCQAVASDVQVSKDGTLMDPIHVRTRSDPANLTLSFTIPLPEIPPELILTEVITCMFPPNAPENSKYQVTITSFKGDVEKTRGSRPSINPRNIKLKFFYR